MGLIKLNDAFNFKNLGATIGKEDLKEFVGFMNSKKFTNNYVDNFFNDSFGDQSTYDISSKEYAELKIAGQRSLDGYLNQFLNVRVLLKQLFDSKYYLYDTQTNIIEEVTNFNVVKNGYNYLINMPIYSMTLDKVEELNKELNKINNEIEIVFNKDIKTMWIEELDELLGYMKKLI